MLHYTIHSTFDYISWIILTKTTHFLRNFIQLFYVWIYKMNKHACKVSRQLIHGLANRDYDNLVMRLLTSIHCEWEFSFETVKMERIQTTEILYIIYQKQWISSHFLNICCVIWWMSFRFVYYILFEWCCPVYEGSDEIFAKISTKIISNLINKLQTRIEIQGRRKHFLITHLLINNFTSSIHAWVILSCMLWNKLNVMKNVKRKILRIPFICRRE